MLSKVVLALLGVPCALIGQQVRPIQSGDTVRVTIEQARSLAINQNPELAAARLDVEIARGDLRQAGTIRSNPTVDVLAAGTSDSRVELGVAQEWEVWGQRGLRTSVARSQLRRAEFSTSDALRGLLLDVDRTYFRAFVAARRAQLSRELLALNQRLSDVAQAQMREGEISKLDFNLAMIELGRSQARDIGALRAQQEAEIELRRLLGLPQLTALQLAVDSAHQHVSADSLRATIERGVAGTIGGRTVEQLTAIAMSRRPDLLAREAALQGALDDIRLAQRETRPNLVPRLSTEGTESGSLGLRPGLGFTLPILNRNRGTVEARRAAARQLELERAAIGLRIRTEIEVAAKAYRAAAAEVEILESTVLVPARENRLLLEVAYREGKVGLPVLLLIRNQVIEAEQEYWSAWLTEREALAALAAATGESIPPMTTGTSR